MRATPLVTLALVSACFAGRQRAPTPPPQPFGYARELGELFEALADLEHSSGSALDTQRAAHGLIEVFGAVCKNYEVSCDETAWRGPWQNRGQVGLHLAHGLSAIDRVYAVWSRDRDSRLEHSVQKLDEVRREVRDLIFTREHVGVSHLPDHRELLIAGAELRYARALIGDGPPPAEFPWDANTTRTVLDESSAVLDAHWPDDTATAHYMPDPADFANIKYVGHLLIARDLVERALDDVHADKARSEEHGRGPLTALVKPLKEATYALGGTITLATHPAVAQPPSAPTYHYEQEIQMLALARREVAGANRRQDERLHAVAEEALKDAFLAACAAEGLSPDEKRWTPTLVEPRIPIFGLETVDAVFSQVPDGRFGETRSHLAIALSAMDQLAALHIGLEPSGFAYHALHDQLVLARNMLDVTPPADHPWDAARTVADLNAAIAAIAAAKLDGPGHTDRFHHEAPNLDYQLRLVVAHDSIERTLLAAERERGAGPRTSLVKARAVVDALAAVLAHNPVTAQRQPARR